MSSYREVLERAGDLVPMPEPALERLADRRRTRQRNQRVFAGAVGVSLAFVLVIALIGVARELKDRDPIQQQSPSPSLTAPLDLLPPANAPTTSGGYSRLLFWGRSGDASGATQFVYLYEDGRVITNPGPHDALLDTRWEERRLTAQGVRLMVDAAHDALAGQGPLVVEGSDGWHQYSLTPGYDDVVDWGRRGWVPNSAPVADHSTAHALLALSDLLHTPERILPPSAWDRVEAVPFVPEAYLLTLDRLHQKLPPGRTNISEVQVPIGTSLPSIGGCSTLNLKAARELSAALDSVDDRFSFDAPMPGVGLAWAFSSDDGKPVLVSILMPLPHESCDEPPDR